MEASSRIFAGSLLVAIMSSLRYSDAMHIRWSSLSLAGAVLRGVIYRSKACRPGMPFGLDGSGLLSAPTFSNVFGGVAGPTQRHAPLKP